MRKRDREKYETRLLDLRKELLRELQKDMQEGREAEAGDGRDNYDIASDERDREINLLLGDRERNKLNAIDEALSRIESGEYGLCEECEGDIASGRLSVMPFSRLCVTCQEESEQAQRTMSNTSNPISPARAATSDFDDDAS
jgi:DnaK suppressor protein